MNPQAITTDRLSALPGQYGRASHYDFDNPEKWVTVENVPLLDEHEMTGEDGQPLAYVDKTALEEIAHNNNKRVLETGDPATLILGHTSDDPLAPEKPAKGFVVNYRVKPFKRDPATGQVIYAVHGDYKVRPRNAHLIEEFPRRSVELWWNKKELDPIAMLGGTTPERDLSVVIRKQRINAVCLDTRPAPPGMRASWIEGGAAVADAPFPTVADGLIRFHKRGNHWIENYTVPQEYAMPRIGQTPRRYAAEGNGARATEEAEFPGEGDQDADADLPESEDYSSPGDDGGATESDPAVAAVLASKEFRDLADKVNTIFQALMGDEQGQGGDGGGEPGMGGPGMPPGAGPEGPGMPGETPGGGTDPEMEERDMHGEEPVRFDSTGMPGPGNTAIPGMNGSKGRRVAPNVSYNRRSTNGSKPVPSQELVRMQRQLDTVTRSNEALLLKLARKDAEVTVNQLEQEGILFGDTPEEARAVKAEEAEFLALLDEENRAHHVNNVIRKRYRRQNRVPANNAMPGVARYARDPNATTAEDGEFDPADPMEANVYADLQTVRKMSRAEAKKVMLQRRKELRG